jgi:hypothetical protein
LARACTQTPLTEQTPQMGWWWPCLVWNALGQRSITKQSTWEGFPFPHITILQTIIFEF